MPAATPAISRLVGQARPSDGVRPVPRGSTNAARASAPRVTAPARSASAVVRWGLPTTTALADLAGAVTLGALALAAFVLPRGTGRTPSEGRAWPTSLLIAGVAAGIWTVLALLRLVLVYANVAGRPVGGAAFGAELGLFVGGITLGRILLGVVVIAAVTCVVVLLIGTPRGALVAGLLAMSALVLQAQTGHSAGSTSHEPAHPQGDAQQVQEHRGHRELVAGAPRGVPGLGPDLTAAVSRYSV